MISNDILIQRITERRIALGLTERDVSIRATGKADAIRFIRSRGSKPSFERLTKIAKVLETHPSYLAGESDDVAGEVVAGTLPRAFFDYDAIKPLMDEMVKGMPRNPDRQADYLATMIGPMLDFWGRTPPPLLKE